MERLRRVVWFRAKKLAYNCSDFRVYGWQNGECCGRTCTEAVITILIIVVILVLCIIARPMSSTRAKLHNLDNDAEFTTDLMVSCR